MSGRVVVVGSANTDMVVRVPRLPERGETILGGDFASLAGGKGANQAVAAARLGASVEFVGCVGRDPLGDQALAGLQREGILTQHVRQDPAAASGVALILVEESGENLIAVAPGANAHLRAEDVDAAAASLEAADVILVQLEVPLAAVARAVEIGHAAGKRVVLNPAPARPVPDDLLKAVDVLVPNESEARTLLPQALPDGTDLASALLTRGSACVIVTLGREGVAVAEPRHSYRLPAVAVDAVDSTAAGDAFCGALAAGLAAGSEMRSAIAFGVAAAAVSVTRRGAQASLPRREEVPG